MNVVSVRPVTKALPGRFSPGKDDVKRPVKLCIQLHEANSERIIRGHIYSQRTSAYNVKMDVMLHNFN